jgi:hypothetical protein
MPRGRSLTALALIVMALAWSAAARAAGPAGLVVDVSGGKILGVQPFSEIADGSTIAVPSGVRLVFQHYASCRKVTVAGGKVAFTPEGYTITGGTKEAEVRVACPRRLNLKASGEAAGVLLRSIGGGVTLSTRPRCAPRGRTTSRRSGSCRGTPSCTRARSTATCSGGPRGNRRWRPR